MAIADDEKKNEQEGRTNEAYIRRSVLDAIVRICQTARRQPAFAADPKMNDDAHFVEFVIRRDPCLVFEELAEKLFRAKSQEGVNFYMDKYRGKGHAWPVI